MIDLSMVRQLCKELNLEIVGMRWNGARLAVDVLAEKSTMTTTPEIFRAVDQRLQERFTNCVAEVIPPIWGARHCTLIFSWPAQEERLDGMTAEEAHHAATGE